MRNIGMRIRKGALRAQTSIPLKNMVLMVLGRFVSRYQNVCVLCDLHFGVTV